MSESEHQLSQAAFDRLKAELDELTTVGRIRGVVGREVSMRLDKKERRLYACGHDDDHRRTTNE